LQGIYTALICIIYHKETSTFSYQPAMKRKKDMLVKEIHFRLEKMLLKFPRRMYDTWNLIASFFKQIRITWLINTAFFRKPNAACHASTWSTTRQGITPSMKNTLLMIDLFY